MQGFEILLNQKRKLAKHIHKINPNLLNFNHHMSNLYSNYLNLNMSYYQESIVEELNFITTHIRPQIIIYIKFYQEHSKVKDKYLEFAPKQVLFLFVLLGLIIGVWAPLFLDHQSFQEHFFASSTQSRETPGMQDTSSS